MSQNPNSVSQERIDHLLDTAEIEEYTFFGKDHVVCYQLSNGFTVQGRGVCANPANFDIEIGRKFARAEAEKKLWMLEGYLLHNQLEPFEVDGGQWKLVKNKKGAQIILGLGEIRGSHD